MRIMNFKRDLITIIVLSGSFSYVTTPDERKEKKGNRHYLAVL
jgi:hypothetical protein